MICIVRFHKQITLKWLFFCESKAKCEQYRLIHKQMTTFLVNPHTKKRFRHRSYELIIKNKSAASEAQMPE